MDWNGLFYGKLGHYGYYWAAITIVCVILKMIHWEEPLKLWIVAHKAVGGWLGKAVAFAVQSLVNVVVWLLRLIGWGLVCWGQELWYEFQCWRARRNRRRMPADPQFGCAPNYHDFFPKKKKSEGGGRGH